MINLKTNEITISNSQINNVLNNQDRYISRTTSRDRNRMTQNILTRSNHM